MLGVNIKLSTTWATTIFATFCKVFALG
ncbi:hypothetical protein PP427_gp270 [Salmonella phage KM16]|nr:hypothetical protein PP427_gp270 [Salmonella phage KM16]